MATLLLCAVYGVWQTSPEGTERRSDESWRPALVAAPQGRYSFCRSLPAERGTDHVAERRELDMSRRRHVPPPPIVQTPSPPGKRSPPAGGGSERKFGVRGGSSKFRGVSWYKLASKWVAQISIEGKPTFLGYFEGALFFVTTNHRVLHVHRTRCLRSFEDEIEAARRFDEFAVRFGRKLNFPEEYGESNLPPVAKVKSRAAMGLYNGSLVPTKKPPPVVSPPSRYTPYVASRVYMGFQQKNITWMCW